MSLPASLNGTMLIRVDVYPDATGRISKTLYASLATTRNSSGDENKGCLIAVGRKSGDVIFQSDKTVSRQHCKLRLIVARKDDGEELDGGFANLLVAPRNDDEAKACHQSPVGMCMVLENEGKGGSFVAVPKEKPPMVDNGDDSATDDGGEKSEEDEETDDEGISQRYRSQRSYASRDASQQNQKADFSQVNRQFWLRQNKQPYRDVELVGLEVGGSRVLQFPTTVGRNRNAERTIMIQCGINESTIAITLLEYRLSFSNLPKPQRETAQHRLPILMGARFVPNHLPDSTTTHLVTSRLAGVPKQLIAWSYRIPMVTLEFFQAIMDRNSPSDPFPRVEDFDCLKQADIQGQFWSAMNPNPQLLSSFTLLSVQSDEMERLAEAAGIQLLRLYDLESDEDAIQEAEDLVLQGAICMSISSRRPLSKQLEKYLGEKIHMITPKELAKCVSEQDPNLLVGSKSRSLRNQSDSKLPSETMKDTDDPCRHEESPSDTIMSGGVSQALLDSPSGSRRRALMDITEEVEEEGILNSHGNNSSGDGREASKGTASLSMDADASTKQDRANKTNGNGNVNLTSSLGKVDSDGWYYTAPKNDKTRKEWRKRALEAASEDRNDFSLAPPAETGMMAVFPLSASEQQQRTSRTSYYYSSKSPSASVSFAQQQSGPARNFKKFRKNYVSPKPVLPFRISYSSVLPNNDKNDDKAREMNEAREELEEQQRIADELFRGDGMAAMKPRRRRN